MSLFCVNTYVYFRKFSASKHLGWIYIYYVYIYFDKGKFELIKEIFSVAKS